MNDWKDLATFEIEEQAALLEAGGDKLLDIFCKGWEITKSTLEAIRALVKNGIVKIVIGIIITAGDKLYEARCQG